MPKPEAVLLDTCAIIWLMNRQPMSEDSLAAIRAAQTARVGVFVSAVTAWEIGTLVAKGRIQISQSVETWFERAIAQPGVRLTPLSPAILIRSTTLPGSPPADPADRMVLATARELGCPVVTRDVRMLAYGRAGHVRAVSC